MNTKKLVADYLAERPYHKERKYMEAITLSILQDTGLISKGELMIRAVHSIGRELRRVLPNDKKGVRLEKVEREKHIRDKGTLF